MASLHTVAEQIHLNPFDHEFAARRFIVHFGLGEPAPSQAYLLRILHYFARLPYENISKIIKLSKGFASPLRIRLPEEVLEEYLRLHLGGTCFSLSFLLHSILCHVGYDNYIVMANMRNRPNVHCALVVRFNEKHFLVDPGYILNQPMEIHPDRNRLHRSSHTGVELKFDHEEGRYDLSTFDRQVVKWRYSFANRPEPPDDFLSHWLHSFYQGTMHGICLTQVREEGLIYVHDEYLQISTPEGKRKKKIRENYHQVIAELFGIAPELIEQAQEAMTLNMEMEKERGIFRPKPRAVAHGTG